MSMQKLYKVKVDISKKYAMPAFEVNTNDLKSIRLSIEILNGSAPLDLSDKTVRIAIRKPDNNIVFQDCKIKDATTGQVEVVLENQAYIMPGTHTAEIMCYKGSDVVAVTGTFSYKSTKGIMNDEAVESKSEFTAIDRKIEEARKLLEDIGENGVGVDEQARQEIQEVSAQLAEKTNNLNSEKLFIKARNNNSQIRPMFSIITDDGRAEDMGMLDLFKRKGIKAGAAIISDYIGSNNYMNATQLKTLHSEGWEIALHDTLHREMTTLTEDELDSAMKNGKKKIEDLGIPCNGLVVPYGMINPLVSKTAEKYFKYCFGENKGGRNNEGIATYNLNRVTHGNEYTWQSYKNAVDFGIKNNQWVVFCTHWYQLNDEQKQLMSDLIDYIQGLGYEIVTPSEALEVFGNTIEYRNYDTNDYFCVSKSGKSISSGIYRNYEHVTKTTRNDTPITDFDYNKLSVAQFTDGTSLGFPVNSGVLQTYRDKFEDFDTYGYQIIIPVFGSDNSIRYRQWEKTTKSWKSWNKIEMNVSVPIVIDSINNKTVNSPITDFQSGKVTYTTMSGTNAKGFLNSSGGVLITTRTHGTDNGFQFQEYHVSNSSNSYKRYVKSDGTWADWRKDIRVAEYSRTVESTVIAANSDAERTVSLYGANFTSVISAFPKVNPPRGIMFNVLIHPNLNNIIIRFANITGASITVPETEWQIMMG